MSGQMVILRGVSGSGKSTEAKKLAAEEELSGGKAVICSADDFFFSKGTYNFDPKLLPQAHAWCRGKAIGAILGGADLVVIDNTNLTKWEYAPYVEMAELNGTECKIVSIGTTKEEDLELYAKRNLHGVPLDKIKKMATKFQQ